MSSSRRLLYGLIAVSALAGSVSGPRAEVSADRRTNSVPATIVMAITEGSDPIGAVAWQPVRPLPSTWILNGSGYDRGDGRPDMDFMPGSQWPVVVWAYHNVDSDHDIALAQWTGGGWSAPMFLTSDVADELDPRTFVRTDGTIDVVWWSVGAPDRVSLASWNPAQETFGPVVPITETGAEGRRPSVVFYGGASWVAFERTGNQADMTQEVVVARRADASGTFATELTVSTPSTGRLDPILHVSRGRMWLDWLNADGQMGYTVLGATGWTTPVFDSYSDTSWVGVETARKITRQRAMNDDTANVSPADP